MVKAVYWFRRAAEQGDAIGQLNLGEHYLTGQGVKHDPVGLYVAVDWAAAKRRKLPVHLIRDQIFRALARINAWRPRER